VSLSKVSGREADFSDQGHWWLTAPVEPPLHDREAIQIDLDSTFVSLATPPRERDSTFVRVELPRNDLDCNKIRLDAT
jgi:hypothetical protein